MKTLSRIFIVLLVTAAFTAGVYFFFTYSGISIGPTGGGPGGGFDRGAPPSAPAADGSTTSTSGTTTTTDGSAATGSTSVQTKPQRGAGGPGGPGGGAFPAGARPEGMGGEGQLNLSRGLPELGRNLGIIALITLAVVLPQKAYAWLKRRKTATA